MPIRNVYCCRNDFLAEIEKREKALAENKNEIIDDSENKNEIIDDSENKNEIIEEPEMDPAKDSKPDQELMLKPGDAVFVYKEYCSETDFFWTNTETGAKTEELRVYIVDKGTEMYLVFAAIP